jgi:uncharacterized CHY-type Zn-finger protein
MVTQRAIGRQIVHGVEITDRTGCRHYHSPSDLVAIKFRCCRTYYACITCHHELAGHAVVVWPKAEYAATAILCGACQGELSISAYMQCQARCPHCAAAFNPGCAHHYHYYFEM